MEFSILRDLIELEYEIKVESLEKVKNTYKINGNKGYCLKVIKYDYPHFSFILGAIKHLNEKKFNGVLNLIQTKSKKDYIKIDKKYGYLTRWIESEESDFDNIDLVGKISEKISEMHINSKGFIINRESRPRIYWRCWIKVFETRRNEMFDFKKRILQKAYKNDFDKLYLSNFNEQIEIANKAIEGLKKSDYFKIMDKEIMKMGFCHHDLANHNILIDKDKNIKFIDFDYCILDSGLHDLASFIWRVNKFNSNTSKEKVCSIIKGYSKNIELRENDIEIIRNFLKFPNDFWQIGLQAYWEMQPWGEEFMINKLENYFKLMENKENTINLIKF